MLVNQNRVLLVVIAVAIGCLVNMSEMKLKDPMMKAGVFAICLYVAYWFLNRQGLVEVMSVIPVPSLQDMAVSGNEDIGKEWCTKAGEEDCLDGDENSGNKMLMTFGDARHQTVAEEAAVARCAAWMREGFWQVRDPENDGSDLCGTDAAAVAIAEKSWCKGLTGLEWSQCFL